MSNKNQPGKASIQKKIVTVIVLLFLFMFGILYGLFYNSMQKILLEREYEQMNSQLIQAKNILESPVDYLPDVTKSWASDWDNAYNYVLGEFDGFPEYYLNDYPFTLYNLDFITVLDVGANVLYERVYQHASNKKLNANMDLTEVYTKTAALTLNSFSKAGSLADASQTGVHGFVKVEGGVYYISAQPITREDKTGNCVGTLIFGKIVQNELAYLNYDPNGKISVENTTELLLPEAEKQQLAKNETLIRTNTQGEIEAYIQLKNLFGGNDLFLSMASPRYLYNDGLLFILFNLAAITLFCAVMIFTVIKLLGRIVVKPLASLVGEVDRIDFESVRSSLGTQYQNREFNFLAQAVNNMLERIKAHRDVIEKNNKNLYYQANFDVLTGLKNRMRIGDDLSDIIDAAGQDFSHIAVFLLDLDRFKFVNDTLGHSAGDAYIIAIAQRLRKELKQEPVIGRLGGDEFAIIVTGISEKHRVHLYADTIMALFEAPFIVKDRAMYISASVGCSVYPDDGRDIDTLLKNSEIAMYRAKELGGKLYCRYESALNNVLQRKLYIENRIRSAISRGCCEFEAYFQPKVLSESGLIPSCEALIRWVTPDGVIGPNEFIPLAEETGLIVPLSAWMLEEACRCNKLFETQGINNTVSVNIPSQVLLHKDFLTMVTQAAEKSGVSGSKLDIEITEATLVEDFEKVNEVLNTLHQMGVTVSIDDFGTGYSSLSYLKKLPIDRIKIDRSFITNLTMDDEDKSLVNAIIAMAKSLHLLVTAEGVENVEQFAYLKSVGCQEIQGYHISRPIPCQEYITFHKKWSGDAPIVL